MLALDLKQMANKTISTVVRTAFSVTVHDRLSFWNLSVLTLTGMIGVLHVIHLALLNHLDFIQQQHSKKSVTSAEYTSHDEEAKRLFPILEIALKHDEVLDSSGTYRISTKISRTRKDTTSSLPSPEITLVTHSSHYHLHKVIATAQYWQGPISVAVYANNNEMGVALWKIASLMACHPEVRSYVSFSMVSPVPAHSSPPLELPSPSPFGTCSFDFMDDIPIFRDKIPVNILRNAARRAASSEFVLVIDIDMLPSENLRQDFLLFAAQKGLYKRQTPFHKSVFVLPTFESREDAEVPLNKAHLLSLMETGEVRPYFSEICRKCQERTNYEGWVKDPIGNEMAPLTTVLWKDPWEPFYIARNNVPFYDERFKNHGYNRISQMCELHVSGYVFSVMKSSFLIHRGFKSLESFNLETESEQNNDLMFYQQFKAELKVKYIYSTRKC